MSKQPNCIEYLCNACKTGGFQQVKYWLSQGVDINSTFKESDGAERTPLQYAANAGHLDIVRLLVASKAKISKGRIDTAATPLYIAAQEGHLEVAQLLIESGADINQATTKRTTPIWIA